MSIPLLVGRRDFVVIIGGHKDGPFHARDKNEMTQLVRTCAALGIGVMLTAPAQAGSRFYLGLDAVHHTLDTSTVTAYSSPQPTDWGHAADTFTGPGFRTGYKFKRRIPDRFFWAPELAVGLLDDEHFIYGTNLRLGYELAPLEIYSSFGVARIEKFTDNRLSYGLGLEYRLNNRTSFSAEWTAYDTIDEFTQSTIFIGAAEVDLRTRTECDLRRFNIGFTYYFQGSI